MYLGDARRRYGIQTDHQLWTSYPGLSAQTWYLTTDGRIAITGGTQCLDEGTNGESSIPSYPLYHYTPLSHFTIPSSRQSLHTPSIFIHIPLEL